MSDKQFTIRIADKLTIGPETAPSGTVNAPYSLAMTASLSDPKTWSIVEGLFHPA